MGYTIVLKDMLVHWNLISAVENGLNKEITCKEVFDLAKAGDERAIKAIDLMIEKL